MPYLVDLCSLKSPAWIEIWSNVVLEFCSDERMILKRTDFGMQASYCMQPASGPPSFLLVFDHDFMSIPLSNIPWYHEILYASGLRIHKFIKFCSGWYRDKSFSFFGSYRLEAVAISLFDLKMVSVWPVRGIWAFVYRSLTTLWWYTSLAWE